MTQIHKTLDSDIKLSIQSTHVQTISNILFEKSGIEAIVDTFRFKEVKYEQCFVQLTRSEILMKADDWNYCLGIKNLNDSIL